MKKTEIGKKFYKIVNLLEECSDVVLKNDKGVIIERGMNLDNDVENHYMTYGLEDNLIHLYEGDRELLKIDEESPVILMIESVLGIKVLEYRELVEQVLAEFSDNVGILITHCCDNGEVTEQPPKEMITLVIDTWYDTVSKLDDACINVRTEL